jgi:hypothetical protein
MIVVTVCFKLSNGSIAIVVIMAWPSTVYAWILLDFTIRVGTGFYTVWFCRNLIDLINGVRHTVVISLY